LFSFNLRNPVGGRNKWDSTAVKLRKHESGSDMKSSNTGSNTFKLPLIIHPYHRQKREGYGISNSMDLEMATSHNAGYLQLFFNF
jgi:hypothetical protein